MEVCKINNDVEKVIQNKLLILSHYTGTGKLPAEMSHRCKTNKRKHFSTQDIYIHTKKNVEFIVTRYCRV